MDEDAVILEQWSTYRGRIKFLGATPTVRLVSHISYFLGAQVF